MQQLLSYLEANRDRTLAELKEFIAIRVSAPSRISADICAAARMDFIAPESHRLEHAEVMETAGHPLCMLIGSVLRAPTVLLYGHYDVSLSIRGALVFAAF